MLMASAAETRKRKEPKEFPLAEAPFKVEEQKQEESTLIFNATQSTINPQSKSLHFSQSY